MVFKGACRTWLKNQLKDNFIIVSISEAVSVAFEMYVRNAVVCHEYQLSLANSEPFLRPS